jgi:trans-2-enoyl-CoA reductase
MIDEQVEEYYQEKFLQFFEQQAQLDAEHRVRMERLRATHYEKMCRFEVRSVIFLCGMWTLAVVWSLIR